MSKYIDFSDLPPAKGRQLTPNNYNSQSVLVQLQEVERQRKLTPDFLTWSLQFTPLFSGQTNPIAFRGSDKCQLNMSLMHETCNRVGLPLEPSKTQGRLHTITFLGIQLDMIAMEVCLPQIKLTKAIESLTHLRGRKACRKRDLLSLIGTLAHTSKLK